MDQNADNGAHFDLLTAALSESGLGDLADEFGETNEDESVGLPNQGVIAQPAVAQATPTIIRTPQPQPQVIRINTPSSVTSHGQTITVTLPQRMVAGADPQGSRTPVTAKVIRLPNTTTSSSSLLQRAATIAAPVIRRQSPVIQGQRPAGQHIVQRVLTSGPGGPGSRVIISQVANGSVGAGGKSFIVTSQGGVVPAAQGSKGVVLTPQGPGTAGAPRKLYVRNGQVQAIRSPAPNGQQVVYTNLNQSQQLLQTTTPGIRPPQQFVITQSNGQVLHVTSSLASSPATPNSSRIGGGGQVVSVTPQRSASVMRSASANQIQVLQRSASTPVAHILSKAGLSGAKVITASQAPSPGPPPSLQHSPSMPLLANGDGGSRSRSGSPVFGLGNIPTVVSQKLTLGSMGVVSGGGGKQAPTKKDINRMWSNEEMKARAYAHASSKQKKLMLQQQLAREREEDDAEEESEQLGHAETYAEYMPSKLRLGVRHPDAVVETSSLSSVEPPDVHYQLSLPDATIDSGMLSALQLEAITYACQRHNTILPSGERAGYIIGDGAGVGKGRTVAGIIFENYLLGRKRALWLSVSNDLKVDAERDLRDIGAHRIDVYALNKFRYAKLSSRVNNCVKKGVVFATYSSLIGESQSDCKYKTRLKQLLKWCGRDFDGVIVLDECHKAKNLCPVGSSKPTKTGATVLDLQTKLPKARVVYASATGASEPKNMAYMTRLGLWGPGTPFKEFNDFISAVEKRGVGAMELVAMDMKLRGMYIARQLSFKGVSFRIEEIPLDSDFKKVYDDAVDLWMEARSMFQKAADLIEAEHRLRKSMWGQFWSAHQRFFKYLCISAKVRHCVGLARDAIKSDKCVVIGLQSTGEARTMELVEEVGTDLNDFVSTAKGVFQTLVEKHFPAPNRQKTMDMLGLMTPNNDNTLKRKREEEERESKRLKKEESSFSESSDLSSDFSEIESSESESDPDDSIPFQNGSDSDDDPWLRVRKPKKKKQKKKESPKKKKKKKKRKKEEPSDDEEDRICDKMLTQVGLMRNSAFSAATLNGDSSGSNMVTNGTEQAFSMKTELLNLIEQLGDRLPPNTLDQLIDELGGPDNVAEMTGRKGRVVQNHEGIQYESRSESDVSLEVLNLKEKQRFMDGEKDIAIISEAASSGISLHADRRAANQKRRVHITLELPWSADRAIQQFGRTHRSNQVSAPEYVFLISELAGERRFAATVSKRLESLGALTHGDRRATETRDLSRFNIDNRYGRSALEAVMKSVLLMEAPIVDPPKTYKGNFYRDVKLSLEGVGLVTIDPHNNNIVTLDKDYQNISKFLNRLLGMQVTVQNSLFEYFNRTLSTIILDAKRFGKWDMGILDLGSGKERVTKLETKVFVGNTATNTAKTELTTVQVERGMSWEEAMECWRRCKTLDEGFFVSLQERNMKRTSILVVEQGRSKKRERMYVIYRPNTGPQARQETLDEIKKKYKKVLPDDAHKWWLDQYLASASCCIHAYWNGQCKKANLGLSCEIGLRTRLYHVLSGSVLSVWSQVENVLTTMPGGNHSKMQVIRLRTSDNQRIVGSLIPTNCLSQLTGVLSRDSAKSYTINAHNALQAALNGLRGDYNSRPGSSATATATATNGFPGSSTSPSVNGTSAQDSTEQKPSTSRVVEPVLSMPTFDFL